jgi:hypothetical protein
VTAPVCACCQRPLPPESPSPDWCSEECQHRWAAGEAPAGPVEAIRTVGTSFRTAVESFAELGRAVVSTFADAPADSRGDDASLPSRERINGAGDFEQP